MNSMGAVIGSQGVSVAFTTKFALLLLFALYQQHPKYDGLSVWNANLTSRPLVLRSHFFLRVEIKCFGLLSFF